MALLGRLAVKIAVSPQAGVFSNVMIGTGRDTCDFALRQKNKQSISTAILVRIFSDVLELKFNVLRTTLIILLILIINQLCKNWKTIGNKPLRFCQMTKP